MMNRLERRQFYNSSEWRALRQYVLARDNYECQMCKAEGRVTTDQTAVLEVDQIKELAYYPELAWDADNLRTLCKDCHNKRHKRFNYRRLNKKKNKWEVDEWLHD